MHSKPVSSGSSFSGLLLFTFSLLKSVPNRYDLSQIKYLVSDF